MGRTKLLEAGPVLASRMPRQGCDPTAFGGHWPRAGPSRRPGWLGRALEWTALIVVDMRNAYCSRGGYIDRCGFDVPGAPPAIAETRRVIDACKAAGIIVVCLQNGFEPDGSDVGGPGAPPCHKSSALEFCCR